MLTFCSGNTLTPNSVEFTNQYKPELHDNIAFILSKVHFPVFRDFYEIERKVAMG